MKLNWFRTALLPERRIVFIVSYNSGNVMFSSLMMTCFISPTSSPSYLDLQKANVISHFHPNVYYHPLNQPVNLIWGFHNLFLISIFQINIQIWVCCSQNILTWCFKMTKKKKQCKSVWLFITVIVSKPHAWKIDEQFLLFLLPSPCDRFMGHWWLMTDELAFIQSLISQFTVSLLHHI